MDCDHHLLIDVSASTVLHNNLGDRGPDLGEPTLRYGGIGSLDGRSIDLLIEVVAGYDYSAPSSLSANGLDDGSGNGGDTSVNGASPSEGFTKINMAFGSTTRLRYTFLWSETDSDQIALTLLNWCDRNPNPNPETSSNPSPDPDPDPTPTPNQVLLRPRRLRPRRRAGRRVCAAQVRGPKTLTLTLALTPTLNPNPNPNP